MSELKCLIELNKGEGILVKLKNPNSNIVQTIILNGTSIVTTCKGESETSIITQKDESIVMKCKSFSVEAETIEMTSKKETNHKSGGDMALESKKNLSNKASQKIKLDSSDTDIKASSSLKMKSATAKIESDATMKLKSASIDVSATAKAKVSGSAMVEISGGIVKLQ